MVSWKSSVSRTEKREEHMLPFTLEICSLICAAAIISPGQYGGGVFRCNIHKSDEKERSDLDRKDAFPFDSRWLFSSSGELSEELKRIPMFVCRTQNQNCGQKKKKKKRKIQIGSRFVKCKTW